MFLVDKKLLKIIKFLAKNDVIKILNLWFALKMHRNFIVNKIAINSNKLV